VGQRGERGDAVAAWGQGLPKSNPPLLCHALRQRVPGSGRLYRYRQYPHGIPQLEALQRDRLGDRSDRRGGVLPLMLNSAVRATRRGAAPVECRLSASTPLLPALLYLRHQGRPEAWEARQQERAAPLSVAVDAENRATEAALAPKVVAWLSWH
jgi:hypothetical protein